jgi:hypothetical protein
MEYRNVSDHVEDLATGQTLGPGEAADLARKDLDEDHNKRLVEEGLLIPTDGKQSKEGG